MVVQAAVHALVEGDELASHLIRPRTAGIREHHELLPPVPLGGRKLDQARTRELAHHVVDRLLGGAHLARDQASDLGDLKMG